MPDEFEFNCPDCGGLCRYDVIHKCDSNKDKNHDKEVLHHPWCNYFMRPRKDCKLCEKLYKKCPVENEDSFEDLHQRYFPEAIKR